MFRKLACAVLILALGLIAIPVSAQGDGATTANGWYEGEEIYYILGGVEEGVTARGGNDLYLIGGDRKFQANVAEFIPGEAGYTPHWNVNVVSTAHEVTLDDILAFTREVGVRLLSLSSVSPSLEEAFLSLLESYHEGRHQEVP